MFSAPPTVCNPLVQVCLTVRCLKSAGVVHTTQLQHFAQCCILPGGELTNVAGVIEPVDVTSEHYERVAARKAEEEAQAAADAAKGEEWGAAAAP